MPDIGFVNGRFTPLSETMVPVEDRGYQFGDGVYEVIRTYNGVPFQLEAHLARLSRSARAIEITEPYSFSDWAKHIAQGVALAGYRESKVYVQVSRGVAPRDHIFPPSLAPTAVMTIREMKALDSTLSANGVPAITSDDLRWGRCDIKSINLLPNLLARQHAKAAGAFEAILHRAEAVTEGSVSNVMTVQAGVVITPPESSWILPGVTRSVVLELARKAGIPVQERPMSLGELRAATEIFLTGTTVEILSVIRLDGAPVGAGKPGPLATRLQALFQKALE